MTLTELREGRTAVIVSLPSREQARLRAVGITAGAQITLLRRAPLGDPSEYGIGGSRFALRKSLTDKIIIEGAR